MTSIALMLLLVVIAGCKPAQEITNFEECVQAGNPVMESHPARCRTQDGRTFVQELPESPDIGMPVPGADVSEISVGMPVPGSDVPEMIVDTSPSLIHDLPVPPAVDAARKYIMQKTGAERSQMVVLEAHEREWPDMCLGLANPDEVCAQAIVPGYDIKINAKGRDYQLRTNGDGSDIREASVAESDVVYMT
jgi:hypothetical protein